MQAPYLSLYIKVDVNFDKAILQMRDNESGDVLRQIPSESQLEAYRRAQTSNAARPSEYQETADVYVPESTTESESAPVHTTTSTALAPDVQVSDVSTSSSSSAPVSIDT